MTMKSLPPTNRNWLKVAHKRAGFPIYDHRLLFLRVRRDGGWAGRGGGTERTEKKRRKKKRSTSQPKHLIVSFMVFSVTHVTSPPYEGRSGICFRVTWSTDSAVVKCSTLTADGPQKLVAGCNGSQSEFPIKRIWYIAWAISLPLPQAAAIINVPWFGTPEGRKEKLSANRGCRFAKKVHNRDNELRDDCFPDKSCRAFGRICHICHISLSYNEH